MIAFKTAMRGYDKKEVDAYLHKITEFHESKLREMEECIKRLKDENDYLYAKNSEYHRNEERVSDAILKAMEVKNDLEKQLRKQIELEEDRLNIFKTKWIAFARGLHHANADRVVNDVEKYISDFKKEFSEKATRELDLRQSEPLSPAERSYQKEKLRVGSLARERDLEEKKSAASLLDESCRESGDNHSFIFED